MSRERTRDVGGGGMAVVDEREKLESKGKREKIDT